ncbi:lysine transporter LysE [Streptomyces sp. NPDC002176]|uniref:lysine transporter LysE n=1 Tax=Streptomyces sp. NPDC002176 TaxID=3364634 RepID=UPI00384C5CA1
MADGSHRTVARRWPRGFGPGRVRGEMLVLGLAGALRQLLSDGIWGLTASTARAWLSRFPHRTALISATGVLTMISLGAAVAVTGRAD